MSRVETEMVVFGLQFFQKLKRQGLTPEIYKESFEFFIELKGHLISDPNSLYQLKYKSDPMM